MSMDEHDSVDWKCACGFTNPDFDKRCNGCAEERYPEDEEPLESGSGLYAMESHRMQEAQALKR